MMNANADFAEQVQIVAGFVPVDMQAAANNGDWVSLKNYERVTVLFFKAAGTANDDPVLTLREATDVAATGVQNLAKISRVYTKTGTLSSVGTFTVVNQTAAATFTDATHAEVQAIYAFDVKAEDLSEGYDCIQCNVADVGGAAQLGCLLYLLWPARYGKIDLPSAIVD